MKYISESRNCRYKKYMRVIGMRKLFIIAMFIPSLIIYGQDLIEHRFLNNLNVELYGIEDKNDTIYFLKTDTLQEKKPVIVFSQGSLPIPLIIKDGQSSFIPALNFDVNNLCNKFHFIILSMPHTPPIEDINNLSSQYTSVAKNGNYNEYYLKDNYLEKYIEREKVALDFLLKQSFVDQEKIYVMGHSQGAYVAVRVAMSHPSVKCVGFLSGDPDGRFAQLVKRYRMAAFQKDITDEVAASEIKKQYEFWREACNDKEPEGYQGDPLSTWRSFSMSFREELITLQIPLFIAYGTKDICALSCDLLPIYFELSNKTNYELFPVTNAGHNFEEILPDGNKNYNNMYWDKVIGAFISFVEKCAIE